jgi:hypothetical protein
MRIAEIQFFQLSFFPLDIYDINPTPCKLMQEVRIFGVCLEKSLLVFHPGLVFPNALDHTARGKPTNKGTITTCSLQGEDLIH